MSDPLALPGEVDDADCCKKCGQLMLWHDCWQIGCDEGSISLYEDDPLAYDENEFVRCDICKGKGGWYVCGNCHPESAK